MGDWHDISLRKMKDLAATSCAELGATGGEWVVNYETGKPFEAPDYDTALFLASAREIVLELARRIETIQDQYSHMSKFQYQVLKAATGEYGTSVGTWEETKFRQACQMVDEGLLTKEIEPIDGRSYFFFITVKGRSVLGVLERDERFNT